MGEIMRWDKYRHLTLLRGILVHSSKFCKISINTFVTEHLLATTSCEPNSFIKIIQLISLNYSWKISQTDKRHSNKLLPRRLFCSARLLGARHYGWAHNAPKITFLDLTTTCHIPEQIWFPEHFLIFLNLLDDQFCAQNLLKETLLRSKIRVLLKVQLFSRNPSPWLCLQVYLRPKMLESAPKLWWSVTRKCLW